jgi:hypothetical protein
VTIQVFSLNSSSNYFYSDVTDAFSNATPNVWNNITIPLDSSGWSSSNSNADWGSVNGLRLQFTWPNNSNVTLLVDGLFFHGPYKSLIEIEGAAYLVDYGISGIFQYVITWILLTGLIYALVKAFKGKIVWKPALVALGFILMTMFIGAVITGIGFLTLPTVRYPFAVIGGVQGEGTAALNTISSQTSLATTIGLISELLVWVWTAALASLVVRTVTEFSWTKSMVVGIIAYFITIIIAGIIG